MSSRPAPVSDWNLSSLAVANYIAHSKSRFSPTFDRPLLRPSDPALITSTMLREVPEPVLKAFGDRGPSALNGDLVQFDADQLPAIKAMLSELGWTVLERPDLRMDLED